MFFDQSDVVKIKKEESLSEFSDFELVRLSQNDIDMYRKRCVWICPSCGCRMPYLDSLLVCGEYYVHSMKCARMIKRSNKSDYKVCNKGMILKHLYDLSFDSIYFNELFARYQDRLIYESRKSHFIDAPDEVYCFLLGAFTKIVGKFAREKSFQSQSDKWFSSFFWTSIQHKLADLQKTASYLKRTPPVRCEITGKEVGQITSKHLYKEAKDVIEREIILRSGETYFSKSEKERKEIFNAESLGIYAEMFPNSYIKNQIVSLNQEINEDTDSEILEISNNSVFGNNESDMEHLITKDTIRTLSKIVMKGLGEESCFEEGLTEGEKTDVIEKIIQAKIDSCGEDNFNEMLIDLNIKGAKIGLTSDVLYFLKNNKECRTCCC